MLVSTFSPRTLHLSKLFSDRTLVGLERAYTLAKPTTDRWWSSEQSKRDPKAKQGFGWDK